MREMVSNELEFACSRIRSAAVVTFRCIGERIAAVAKQPKQGIANAIGRPFHSQLFIAIN